MRTALLSLLALASSSQVTSGKSPSISDEELKKWIEDLRGDDSRLIRWDATEHTAVRQQSGTCDSLKSALDLIADKSSSSDETKRLAADYATLCIADNPKQREAFSDVPNIHSAVVTMAGSKDSATSAIASHLIYIAAFANAKNHRSFYEAGAVTVLSSVLTSSSSSPIQLMWAAAAIQNLAASYCSTEHNGRCFWEWDPNGTHQVITEDSLPVISDGSDIRREILSKDAVVEKLLDLACEGPVRGEMSDENPFPGDNAELNRHEDNVNIIAWAAAGAIKNLALENEGADRFEDDLECFCWLSHSEDWLEQEKGYNIVERIRQDEPCWFETDEESEEVNLCVDHRFVDDEGNTCSDYNGSNEEECAAENSGGVSASEACCACGGGSSDKDLSEDEL